MTGTCRLTSCTPSCHERAQAPALGTWHPLHMMSWALSDLSTPKVLLHTTPLSHGTGCQCTTSQSYQLGQLKELSRASWGGGRLAWPPLLYRFSACSLD